MIETPAYVGQRYETAGAVDTGSRGTTITASASTNTKGSYSEIIASTAFSAMGFWLLVFNPSAQGRFLIDLAIGGSGSEQIIVPNFFTAQPSAKEGVAHAFFPMSIPAGTRLSARCQSNVASIATDVIVLLLGGGNHPLRSGQLVEAYGPITSTTSGVTIDPGGTAHTKGAWAELIGSTARAIHTLVVMANNQNNGTHSFGTTLFDIAIGGAGSEQLVIPNIVRMTDGGPDTDSPQYLGTFPLTIPAGTRIAARSQCSSIDATDRLTYMTAYGVT